MKNQKSMKGFTLVELLIVITIIGVLAGALLVGINPIEQVNKGRDAGAISRAKDVLSACDRYYVANNACPGTCGAMVGTAGELKNAAACTGMTLTCTSGDCSVSFTVQSTYYTTKCGSKTCTLPGAVL